MKKHQIVFSLSVLFLFATIVQVNNYKPSKLEVNIQKIYTSFSNGYEEYFVLSDKGKEYQIERAEFYLNQDSKFMSIQNDNPNKIGTMLGLVSILTAIIGFLIYNNSIEQRFY